MMIGIANTKLFCCQSNDLFIYLFIHSFFFLSGRHNVVGGRKRVVSAHPSPPLAALGCDGGLNGFMIDDDYIDLFTSFFLFFRGRQEKSNNTSRERERGRADGSNERIVQTKNTWERKISK